MMRSFKYIILYSFLFFISISTFTSCGEDDLDESTFGKIKVERNEFDSWLLDNYIKPYNIDLKYRFEDQLPQVLNQILDYTQERENQDLRVSIDNEPQSFM